MSNCPICGQKHLISIKCFDGEICKSCYNLIPDILLPEESVVHKLTVEEIKVFISWVNEQSSLLRKKFYCSQFYGYLKIDSLHSLLAICEDNDLKDNCIKNEDIPIFDITRISNISIDMVPEKIQKNSMPAAVNLSFSYKDFPIEIHNCLIKNDFCKVEMISSTRMQYYLPVGAQIILDELIRINHKAIDDLEFLAKHDLVDGIDYAKATGLFMVEDNYTKEDLKKTRNLLLKVFHPDEQNGDTKYTQTITKAYDILLKHLLNSEKKGEFND